VLHDISRQGVAFSLRPVAIEDAELILELRTDPELGRYLNPTPPGLEGQVSYLERYFEKADEWYFVIEDRAGSPEGVICIYNVDRQNSKAEWGRWVLRKGSLAAAESAVLVNDVAFETLDFDTTFTRTNADNGQVVSFHDRLGAEKVGIVTGPNGMKLIEHRMTSDRWPQAREGMVPAVQAAARLANR
jgi:RimJ/RimL family protein N-acetyltransferase